MDPFDKDELTDRELDEILPAWSAPEMPPGLKARIFPKPWWRRVWRASIRIPVPVACAVVVLAGVAAVRSVVRQGEPEVKERIVYRDRPAEAVVWQPVSELRPRIIRGGNE